LFLDITYNETDCIIPKKPGALLPGEVRRAASLEVQNKKDEKEKT
jgi:hypothetical protein